MKPSEVEAPKNVKPVVLFFSFLRNKPTNITNMSFPKLISNVILICALVCVWAGFRALHQFAVLLLCSNMQLCHGGLVRQKGIEGKTLDEDSTARKYPLFL